MAIMVGEQRVETDDEGYLLNPDDWCEAVAAVMVMEQAQRDGVSMTDTHMGLVHYFREHYTKKKTHPTMHQLVMTLGRQHGSRFHDRKAYEKFLYQLFPRGPVPELCKLAGLPKPSEEFGD